MKFSLERYFFGGALFARVARSKERAPAGLCFCKWIKVEFRTGHKTRLILLRTKLGARHTARLALMSKRVTTVYAEARNAQRPCTSKYKVRHYASFWSANRVNLKCKRISISHDPSATVQRVHATCRGRSYHTRQFTTVYAKRDRPSTSKITIVYS